MALALREIGEHELDAVLALNNAAGPAIVPIDARRLAQLFEHAAYFRGAFIDGHLAAFLIALTPEAAYDSPNFRWFLERYENFVYIDRVVVAAAYRRHGLGRLLYADVTSFAEPRAPLLACEVFIEPPDDVVLLFHGTYGFHEVGQQTVGGRRVAMLVKELCSHPWIRETYLAEGRPGLPELPWLAGRERPARPQRRASARGRDGRP
ncbi:MAG: GNAT family N-acetyltransferase [Xanthomonadales bacterium]|nr:GNAT family N-acetyltransferase [Xanthomonadales bacterium]